MTTITTRFTPNTALGGNALPNPYQRVTGATGDIAIPAGSGTVYITKLTAATDLTLPPPSPDINGAILRVVSLSASAHVVTLTEGTFGGGANSIATFGAVNGNVLTVHALDGIWYYDVGASAGITLSDGG